jgi:flagellar FliJ protein
VSRIGKRRGLTTLQQLAELRADAAARGVSSRLHALRAEEERLRQVRGFIDHYDGLCAGAPGQSLTSGAMQGRRAFAARLRVAADHQQQVTDEHESRLQDDFERWRAARAKALALRRFIERRRARERERRERREQRTLDEMGARRR